MKASQVPARASAIVRDARWKQLRARDPACDGKFFYAVRTTGVYCRPSCASRLPRPENVVFYQSAISARRAGFRACQRCRPDAVSGKSASTARTGGADHEIRYAISECSLGSLLVAQSGRGFCAILFGEDPKALVHDLEKRFPSAKLIRAGREFEKQVVRVVRLVETPAIDSDLPLDMGGTPFQQRVWRALQQIRPRETASYSEIATRIGAPKAARAVARACAANALAVAIPCHRVVRQDGALSGYRWGIERKRALLEREAR